MFLRLRFGVVGRWVEAEGLVFLHVAFGLVSLVLLRPCLAKQGEKIAGLTRSLCSSSICKTIRGSVWSAVSPVGIWR